MPLTGRAWMTYAALMHRVAERQGTTVTVTHEPHAREEELLRDFTAALQRGDGAAHALLSELRLSPRYVQQHLRYLPRWGVDRRKLLAGGANLRLLEGLGAEDRAGRLAGLVLQGRRVDQERALAAHLRQGAPQVRGHGWLEPSPNSGKPVREYSSREVVWVYSSTELAQADDLHPSVARSLIRCYMKAPGVVADPMAGSGTVARMAALMGHRAWASDLSPREPYIAAHDLLAQPLETVLGDAYPILANLVVVHPPTAADLGLSAAAYLDWLLAALGHCWNAVAPGGHVALVVAVGEGIPLVSRAERALLGSAHDAFREEGLLAPVEDLTGQHLAVSRDGRQGWHLLVLKRPTLVTDAEP